MTDMGSCVAEGAPRDMYEPQPSDGKVIVIAPPGDHNAAPLAGPI